MKSTILLSASMLVLSVAAGPRARAADATPAPEPPAAAPANGTEMGEVVVTARRRAESAQTTPVSVTGFSATALQEKDVQLVSDLDTLVPGFRFVSEGGKNTNDVILRGLNRISLGLGLPAVVPYFQEVPLPGIASNVPTYDLESIQVLKGPQGTLFGRNTIGGAVIITAMTPSLEDYEGYIDAQGGNLGRYSFEGALNIPLVKDKLALRIAGQVQRGDGYVKNLSGGADMNDTDENSWRVTLLAEPTDYIKNTLTLDYNLANETAAASYLIGQNYPLASIFPAPLGSILDAQIGSQVAAQHSGGYRVGFSDVNGGYADRRLMGMSNDTRVDINDDLQVHNVLGLRQASNSELIDTAGTNLTLPTPGGPVPFTLFDAAQKQDQQYLTEELQLSGKALGHHLQWIVGGIYNNDYAVGPSGSQFVAFGIPAPKITALIEDHNYALYGQGGLDLSDWLLPGLTFNLGYRYGWDKVHACGGTIGNNYADFSECEAAPHVPGGAGDVNAKGGDPSWTIGLDYKYSEKQFFYVTSRRGYRGVNVNTPLFTTQYTTGGTGCTTPTGLCPDLRPFQTTKPEKLTDVEIGSKTDWELNGWRGRFDIAGYWSSYKNGLQFINTQSAIPSSAPDAPTNASVGVNAVDETIMGVEIGATIKPVHDLTFTFNGAYNNSSIDRVFSPSSTLALSKNEITLPTPKLSGSVDARWITPYAPLGAQLVVDADIYGTQRFGAQYGQTFGGYATLDMRIDLIGVRGSGLNAGIFAKNLLDKGYLLSPVVVLPSFPVATGVAGEPRTYGVDLRYSF